MNTQRPLEILKLTEKYLIKRIIFANFIVIIISDRRKKQKPSISTRQRIALLSFALGIAAASIK